MKSKEIQTLSKTDKEKKLKELKMELIKARTNTTQKGKKVKEIKKIIARILTSNTQKK